MRWARISVNCGVFFLFTTYIVSFVSYEEYRTCRRQDKNWTEILGKINVTNRNTGCGVNGPGTRKSKTGKHEAWETDVGCGHGRWQSDKDEGNHRYYVQKQGQQDTGEESAGQVINTEGNQEEVRHRKQAFKINQEIQRKPQTQP